MTLSVFHKSLSRILGVFSQFSRSFLVCYILIKVKFGGTENERFSTNFIATAGAGSELCLW